ncbi:PspA/IM30 family protein [Kordiimonas laminariae]|uniref:PspA/IM30 family protein n=1 Tax=Kordiimonas laminariae TaxID=2917717 RepID=UPI001FF548F4|nr:PspA/IM30 family protein [Kordiimonas laminariae]MCK0068079.1 PspA/IM30 family protein [Kordiimonas laminariae]
MANLASRVGRLISGSINAAVDAVEDMSPLMVMEQSVREVDEAIAEVRTEMGKATADRHLANKKLAENSGKHEELASHIEVAIKEGRDDLAEAAISRQMDIEAQIPVLEEAVSEASDREGELEKYIDALRGKKAEMLEELQVFKTRMAEQPENTVIDAGGNPSAAHDVNRKVDNASSAFDRISGALSTGDVKNGADIAELAQLARKSEIEKRLAALKNE